MKKINKLVISPEKIMKNEELINLQGGYGGSGPCLLTCEDYFGGDYHTYPVSDCNNWEALNNTCSYYGVGPAIKCEC